MKNPLKGMMKDSMTITATGIGLGVGASAMGEAGADTGAISKRGKGLGIIGSLTAMKYTLGALDQIKIKKK